MARASSRGHCVDPDHAYKYIFLARSGVIFEPVRPPNKQTVQKTKSTGNLNTKVRLGFYVGIFTNGVGIRQRQWPLKENSASHPEQPICAFSNRVRGWNTLHNPQFGTFYNDGILINTPCSENIVSSSLGSRDILFLSESRLPSLSKGWIQFGCSPTRSEAELFEDLVKKSKKTTGRGCPVLRRDACRRDVWDFEFDIFFWEHVRRQHF